MHVYTYYTDHGYRKEMVREIVFCVFISCLYSKVAILRLAIGLCISNGVSILSLDYKGTHLLEVNGLTPFYDISSSYVAGFYVGVRNFAFQRFAGVLCARRKVSLIIEPRHEKTNVLHMRKQRRRSASR